MTVLNTGSTKKFAAGWEGIFAKGTRGAKSAAAKKKVAKNTASTVKKGSKKATAKKSPPRGKK